VEIVFLSLEWVNFWFFEPGKISIFSPKFQVGGTCFRLNTCDEQLPLADSFPPLRIGSILRLIMLKSPPPPEGMENFSRESCSPSFSKVRYVSSSFF